MTDQLVALDIGGSGLKVAQVRWPSSLDEQLVIDDEVAYRQVDWPNIESWLATKKDLSGALVGVCCAGFVYSESGVVRSVRAANWTTRDLGARLERQFAGSKVFVLNDAEAHLLGHQGLAHPLMCIVLGTAVGFAITTPEGNLLRPRPDRNYDIGELRLDTRHHDKEVWRALGSQGLANLEQTQGTQAGRRHFGLRLGAFLAQFASLWQPKTIVLSGGIVHSIGKALQQPIAEAFSQRKAAWLEMPELMLSPHPQTAGLLGAARFAILSRTNIIDQSLAAIIKRNTNIKES